MFDSFNPASLRNQPGRMIRMDRLKFHLVSLWRLDAKQAIAYAGERVRTLTERMRARSWRASYKLHLLVDRRMDHLLRKADQVLRHSVLEYCPGPYEGSVLVVRAQIRPAGTYADAGFGWRNLVPDLEVVEVPGNHRDMLAEPNVEMLANALNDRFSALC